MTFKILKSTMDDLMRQSEKYARQFVHVEMLYLDRKANIEDVNEARKQFIEADELFFEAQDQYFTLLRSSMGLNA